MRHVCWQVDFYRNMSDFYSRVRPLDIWVLKKVVYCLGDGKWTTRGYPDPTHNRETQLRITRIYWAVDPDSNKGQE